MKPQKIFISHSHKDEAFLEELLVYLKPLMRNDTSILWGDSKESEAIHNRETFILKGIEESDYIILLISSNFLVSDFILDKELPLIYQERQKRELPVFAILISHSNWQIIPWLAEVAFLNDPRYPLDTVKASERQLVYFRVANQLERPKNKDTSLAQKKKSLSAPSRKEESIPEYFISHSSSDSDFAELLKLKLEKHGFRAWIDTERLTPGIEWREEIDDAIQKSTALIAIMSPSAKKSEYVTYEWAYAWALKLKVIPIMLERTPLHPRLAVLQYMDFTNRNSRPWNKLYEVLRNAKQNAE